MNGTGAWTNTSDCAFESKKLPGSHRKLDQNGFCVILNVFIGQKGLFATRIALHTSRHSLHLINAELRSPKSSTGKKSNVVNQIQSRAFVVVVIVVVHVLKHLVSNVALGLFCCFVSLA